MKNFFSLSLLGLTLVAATPHPTLRDSLPLPIDPTQNYQYFPEGDAPDGINFRIFNADGSEIIPDLSINARESINPNSAEVVKRDLKVASFTTCSGSPFVAKHGNGKCTGPCHHWNLKEGECKDTPNTQCIEPHHGDGKKLVVCTNECTSQLGPCTPFHDLKHYFHKTHNAHSLGAPDTNRVRYRK